MPDVYRHPEPSSTNPYWEREIAAGPALVARGGNRSKAGKNGNGGRKGSKEVIGSGNASLTGGGSSWDLNVLQQREDERLWGEDTLDGAAAGIQRPGRVARTGLYLLVEMHTAYERELHEGASGWWCWCIRRQYTIQQVESMFFGQLSRAIVGKSSPCRCSARMVRFDVKRWGPRSISFVVLRFRDAKGR